MSSSVAIAAGSAPASGSLFRRARPPSAAELADIAWLHGLDADERRAAVDDLKVVRVGPGEMLCRVGRPATFWFGVIDGLLKMSNETALGVPMTFNGMPPGGWFATPTEICLRGAIAGHGVLDLPAQIKLLKKAGYNGYLSLEFEGVEEPTRGIMLGVDYLKTII